MQNERPMNDPRSIWQNQKTEEMHMSIAEFKKKAQQHFAKARILVIMTDLGYIALVILAAFQFVKTSNLISGVGLTLLAAGAGYVLYQRHRRFWPALTEDVPPVSGLEAYRRRLLKWRDDSFWRAVAPLIPGCILVAIPTFGPIVRSASANPAILMNAVPFMVLFVLWLVLLFPARKRWHRTLQREIDSLDDLLRAGSSAGLG